MPWYVRGTVVSWANRSVGVPSCPAPLRRPAVRRPDPTRPWYVRVLDSTGDGQWPNTFAYCIHDMTQTMPDEFIIRMFQTILEFGSLP